MRRDLIRAKSPKRDAKNSLENWVDKLPGVPVFIIGNSPSVKKHDLTLLNNYFTIGINRVFRIPYDPTILFWQDISLWTTEYDKIHNLQAIKVARNVADPRKAYFNFHLKPGPFKFEPSKAHILYGSGNSMILAAQLAVAMGCSTIVLLGCDCKLNDNGDTSFFGVNQFWSRETLRNCRRALEYLKKHSPVHVISCGGATDLWPEQTLEEVLQSIDPIHKRDRQSYVAQLMSKTHF